MGWYTSPDYTEEIAGIYAGTKGEINVYGRFVAEYIPQEDGDQGGSKEDSKGSGCGSSMAGSIAMIGLLGLGFVIKKRK